MVRERARFIEDYDDNIDQARLDLGKLFRIEDYPSKESLQAKFGIRYRIVPVPDADHFMARLASDDTARVTAWVSDRIQTRVYRRRPLPGLEEHDAMTVRSNRATSAPLSRIALMTADHHRQGAGLRHRMGSDCPRRARREDLDHQFPLGRGGGYDASMSVAPPRPAPTRFGRQRYRTVIVARRSAEDPAPFRVLENAAHDATQGHSGRSAE